MQQRYYNRNPAGRVCKGWSAEDEFLLDQVIDEEKNDFNTEFCHGGGDWEMSCQDCNSKTGGKNAHWNNGLDLTGSGPKGNGFNGYVWSDTYPEGSIIDSRLGGKVTGGRVRVSENNSAWLYNNIGIGTTVYIH